MKEYKIFLASSEELAANRRAFREEILALSNESIFDGKLVPVMWEDFKDSIAEVRLKDEYNKAIDTCDIFVLLFWTKVGDFTLEEFERALKSFKATGKPEIYTFQNGEPVDPDKILPSLITFKERLKELKHFKTKYKNTEDLLHRFNKQLRKLIPLKGNRVIVEPTKSNTSLPKRLGNTPFFPDVFLGRDQDLKDIRKKLNEGATLPLLLVNGRGGIGKTTLAAEYYRTYESEYQHLAWVFAETSILDGILTLAQPLNVQFGAAEPNTSRFKKVLAALRALPKPCLLILDNANKLTDLKKYYKALKTCTNCHLLLTTRITEFGKAKMHAITPLAKKDAKALFVEYYPKHQDTDDELLLAIFAAVGRNTLVIELLAKNLTILNKLGNYPLEELLQDLRKKGLLAIQTKTVDTYYQAGDELREEKPEAIIAAMYDLGELPAREKRLMSIFAVLPAENVAFYMLQTLLPKTEHLDDDLLALAQKGWLDLDGKEKAFKVSPVIQEVTRRKNIDLLRDCKELFDVLDNKLLFDNGLNYLLNASFQEANYFAYYIEIIVDVCSEKNNQIAILCERAGNYFKTTGDLIKALFFFEEYSNLKSEFYKKDLENTYHKERLAISYSKLGDIQISLGNLSKALEYFEERSRLGKELYASYPSNVSFKNGLAISYEKLGKTQSSLGNLSKALEYFEDETVLFKELYASYPSNVSFKNGLAISYEKLGSTQSSLGNLSKALEYFEDETVLFEELYASYPSNVSFKNGLAISYSKLGSTQSSLGNLSKALEYFEDETVLFEELNASYPSNVSFKNNLAISYYKLGQLHEKLEDLDKAYDYYKLDLKFTEETYLSSPNNAQYKKYLIMSYEKMGELAEQKGNIVLSKEYFDKAEMLKE